MVVNTFPTAFRLKAKMIAIDEKRFFTEFAVKLVYKMVKKVGNKRQRIVDRDCLVKNKNKTNFYWNGLVPLLNLCS